MSNLLMTRQEAAQFLGISVCRVQQLGAKGKRLPNDKYSLTEHKIGKRVFVTRDSVQKRYALMLRREERLRQKQLEKEELFERVNRRQKTAAKERELIFEALKASIPHGLTAAEIEKLLGISQSVINNHIYQMRHHVKAVGMRKPFPQSKRAARVWAVHNWIELE